MPLFDKNAALSRMAEKRVATGGDTSNIDVMVKDYETFRDQQQFGAVEDHRKKVYDRIVSAARDSGQEITGPHDRLLNAPLADTLLAGLTRPNLSIEQFEDEFFEDLAKMEGLDPSLPRTREALNDLVGRERQEQINEQADVHSRNRSTFRPVASFAGAVAGAVTDPVVLATLPLGAPGALAARGAMGALRAVTIEAGIGAGTEAVIQAEIQTSRQTVGEEASLSEAATAIAFGAAGGVIVGAGVPAVAATIRSGRQMISRVREGIKKGEIKETPQVNRALHDTEVHVRQLEANPYKASGVGVKAHTNRLDSATRSILKGEPVSFSELPEAPVRGPVSPVVPRSTDIIEELPEALRAATEAFSDTLAQRVNVRQGVSAARRLAAAPSDDVGQVVLNDIRNGLGTSEDLVTFLTNRGFKRNTQAKEAIEMAREAGFPAKDLATFRQAVKDNVSVTPKGERATRAAQVRLAMDTAGVDPFQVASMKEVVEQFDVVARQADEANVHPERLDAAEITDEMVDTDLDVSFQQLLDEDPDLVIEISDGDGPVREVTVKELQEEIDDLPAYGEAYMACLRG